MRRQQLQCHTIIHHVLPFNNTKWLQTSVKDLSDHHMNAHYLTPGLRSKWSVPTLYGLQTSSSFSLLPLIPGSRLTSAYIRTRWTTQYTNLKTPVRRQCPVTNLCLIVKMRGSLLYWKPTPLLLLQNDEAIQLVHWVYLCSCCRPVMPITSINTELHIWLYNNS